MSNQTTHITRSDLNSYLAQIILDDLTNVVDARQPGHCMQVTDLPLDLMESVCRELRIARPGCEAYVLSHTLIQAWHITSTKLVERRNAGEAVIVVFLPPDLRTSAEDSFDVSTFERFSISDLHQRLREQLLADLPSDIRPIVEDIVRESGCGDKDAICRYLLAVRGEDVTSEEIGLALHYLGLIPDRALLDDPSIIRLQLQRNANAVQILSTPDNALFSRIQSLKLNEERTPQALYRFFNQMGTFEPSHWLPAILAQGFADDLTFDQWDFRDKITGGLEEIVLTDLGTTLRNEDGYLLVDLQRDSKLKVAWETTPAPLQCKDLSYFTIEIMKDSVPITEAHTVQVTRSPRKRRSTTLKDLHKKDLEDGLYYLRVSAWASGGVLLLDAESESIFFKGGLEADDEEEWDTSSSRQRQQLVTSLYEAMLRTEIKLRGRDKTLSDLKRVEMSWVTPQRRTGRRYTDQFVIKYGATNQYVLPVNTILRHIEEEILSDATSLGRLKLDLSRPPTAEIEPILQPFEGIDYDLLDEFILLRQDLFQKILNQPTNPDIHFLVETSDLSQWENEITRCAQAYLDVLDQLTGRLTGASDDVVRSILHANRQVTSIDNVRLRLADGQDVYLIAPTHPLKLLWGLQYARVTRCWLSDIETLPGSRVSWNTFASFLPRLSSINLPHTMVDAQGELLVSIDNFSPFWSIYVPLEARDVRALVGRIKALLGSPEADDRFTTITGADLARKVQRYLAQHSYVTTLRLNIVQPGSGAIIVEMLLELERRRPDLRYRLHLFSDDFHREELGAALDELMSPSEKRGGREELDAFLTASQNALFPKLVYSKHALVELLDQPDRFEAHVTFVFDAFKVQVQTADPMPYARSNHLYGLLHEYVERFTSVGGEIAWQRQIVPQHGLDLDEGENKQVHKMMVCLYQRYNHLAAAIASDKLSLDCVPTVHLPLGPTDKNLISQVHQVSDWVFTVDRNFGLEYLDNPYDEHCPAYLIDYQPEYLGEVGHRLIISTHRVAEIEHIVRPVLERLNLPADTSEAHTLINGLRSISGRLVLKLLSSSQLAHGAVGMALARLFLERARLLQDMILIPLDSHLDLFTSAQRDADLLQQELSLRRTDMLLVELEPANAAVTFHLIEVKIRQSSTLTAALGLKDEISAQLENSSQALRHLYDPHFTSPDRFDRLIRTRELATLLGFYLERSARYRLVDSAQVEPMRRLLDQLEQGYTLRFTRSGIVLSLGDQGYQTEKDGEIVYHYLGLDQATALVVAARDAEETGKALTHDPTYATTRGTFTRRPSGQSLRLPKPSAKLEPKPEGEGPAKPLVKASDHTVRPLEAPELPTMPELVCNVILGAKHPTPQYGILGRAANHIVGLDLNGTNTISLFGVQGSGKSYTLGTILEMAVTPIPGINKLPRPLAAVVFHYSKTEDYRPEFVSMAQPNDGPELEKLRELYGVNPVALSDVLVLTPEGKLNQRQAEFPHLDVHPIAFDTSELDIEDWKFLMGVVGSNAMYIKKMNQILRRYRNNLSLENMWQGIGGAKLSDAQVELARTRLDFAAEYIRDGQFLGQLIRPGRLVVVDLRDELIEKDETLGLFMVMLKIFANTHYQGQTFNKLIVFDEAHKYMETAFIGDVAGVVREMRHKGTTVLIASQDPPSVPLPIIELSSQIILHKFSSPGWLKHIQRGATAIKELTPGRLNMLDKGQAYIWSRDASHHEFESRAVKVDIRPRVTKHGGATVTATE